MLGDEEPTALSITGLLRTSAVVALFSDGEGLEVRAIPYGLVPIIPLSWNFSVA